MQIWLSFLCTSMPMCSMAGLHHLAAIDRVNGCGASATTFGGGQPLHSIYPMLQGTIRDHDTKQRRPFLRFFACEEDVSLQPPDAPLPEEVASGKEPFWIIGAIAGG